MKNVFDLTKHHLTEFGRFAVYITGYLAVVAGVPFLGGMAIVYYLLPFIGNWVWLLAFATLLVYGYTVGEIAKAYERRKNRWF
jgi:ABC-type amino acid transport system permease subunit